MKFFAALTLVAVTAIAGVARAEILPTSFVGPGLVNTPAISSVAAGDAHTCIVRNESVWCTGANSSGQLGIGTFVRTTAFAESSMRQITSVSAGGNTTCAVRIDTTVWCWGTIDTSIDTSGTIVRTNSSTPTQLPIVNAQSVAVGASHSCVLLRDGATWCWGSNRFGQLGNGTRTDSVLPVLVAGHTFTSIDVGTQYSCGVDTSRSVWCWGSNAYHRLGLRSSKSQFTPVRVPKVTAHFVATGDAFTCIINTSQKIQCWGRNQYGQLGALAGSSRISPTTVPVKNPRSLVIGSEFACSTTQAATTWCWGRNRFGQLANGSNIAKSRPQKVLTSSSMGAITSLATGTSHACGLNPTIATLWCWGLGTSGQLGDSASSNRTRGTIVWQNGVQLNPIGTATSARLVVTGDISCDYARRATYGVGPLGSQCGEESTANLTANLNPDAVLAVGDLQYEGASISELMSFYEPTWGRFKAKTYPLRGNHEYVTNGAAGYVDYFGPLSPSYWTTDAGSWRIIAVDSWCQGLLFAGCSATSPQTVWLSAQLQKARDEGRCALVAMHHPFVSSGPFATSTVQHLWKAAVAGGADLVVTGHDHHYERFAPLTETGSIATSGGTALIIAGLGGAPTYSLRETAVGSQATDNRQHGVVSLTLTPTGFSSALISAVDGVASDAYSTTCTP
jgi:hypothetical protein